MSKKKQTENNQSPQKITRSDADRLNDFAQDLDDPVTHVVDYGGLDSTESNKDQ